MGNLEDSRESKREKRRGVLPLVAFPLLFVAIFGLIILYRGPVWSVFSSPEKLKNWVASWGLMAPLVFIGIQIVQVVIFIIPGEVPQIAGGYLFGFWLGTLYSSLGIAIGSAVNFYLARLLGVPFVERLFTKDQLARAGRIAESSHARIGFFLLFLIPGIPKDILCYVAGLSPMGFLFFMAVSGLGRLPGILGSALMGDAAADKNWPLLISLSSAAAVLFLAGYFTRTRIQSFLEKVTGKIGLRDSGEKGAGN
jgi:uncharacterized membrane protein YdjX (TVP38/TMEM64 family)